MRSLFWRIFASFWLAVALVAGLSMLLGRALNQDAWVLAHHPALDDFAERWSRVYRSEGPVAAQRFLERRKQRYRVDTQVLGEDGQPLVDGTFPARAAAYEARQDNPRRLPWRRLTEEYSNPATGETYLFIYRIPHPEMMAWHRESLFWPLSALAIALVVLTAVSLLLTLSITRPLGRLRGAVHDLGQTTYQQNSLARLADRGDEFGVLARDFNRMGSRLQDLIGSQRQLLRDVSHE
ncbi:MAG TPA: HAMP domain-containing protein, partial [Pseudomonas sp.]|nr:HAMP domain-containing protein [Pseudomonas sp.]